MNLKSFLEEKEKEGEDGILYCSGCEKQFPKLKGSEGNQIIQDIINSLTIEE